ncbi:MAG: hemerythrin domain-containing protein [Proteobacteria bacterium]|nr:hemerythrin domain-containing protein [Pseudomonadota bacterium]
MHYESRIAQVLHDEHLRVIDLMNRLEGFTTGRKAKLAPAKDDAAAGALLADLKAELQGVSGHHFNFEEENLFPALIAVGDVAIPHMLRQEHDLLRNLSEVMLPMVQEACSNGFTAEAWAAFRDLALELVERQITHIQKEEMGLLPALSGVFEEQQDGELALLFAEA